MNFDELRRQLHGLDVPTASESARARARHRALIALQSPGSEPIATRGEKGFAWKWGYTVALVFLAGFMPLLFLPHRAAPENLTDDRQVLQQMEKLFPHEVDAVVEEKGKVGLSIAQSPVLGSNQPVLVVFRQGRETIRVLSFSGHRLCVTLGKTPSCFEVLATPAGGVILEGGDKAWLASDNPVVNGYSVRARTLDAL